jgi:hypothetical protein
VLDGVGTRTDWTYLEVSKFSRAGGVVKPVSSYVVRMSSFVVMAQQWDRTITPAALAHVSHAIENRGSVPVRS